MTPTEYRKHRNALRHPPTAESARSLFVSGSIGDVFAVSCFFSVSDDVKTIYYASPKFADVREFMRRLAPQAKHVSLWDDWSERTCFYSLDQFLKTGNRAAVGSIDWSIATTFPAAAEFLGWPLNELDSGLLSLLPARYALFQPFTTDKTSPRDFTEQEIQATVSAAAKHGVPLVLINSGDDATIDGVIDLRNQTSLIGSIAVARHAAFFIGTDSSMSVVASKHLPPERMCVKSRNPHLLKWQNLYYAPLNSFEFITTNAEPRLKELQWID